MNQFEQPSNIIPIQIIKDFASKARDYHPQVTTYEGVDTLPERRDQIIQSRKDKIKNFMFTVDRESEKRVGDFPRMYLAKKNREISQGRTLDVESFIEGEINKVHSDPYSFLPAAFAETLSFLAYLREIHEIELLAIVKTSDITDEERTFIEFKVDHWLGDIKIGRGANQIPENLNGSNRLIRNGLDGDSMSCPANKHHLMIVFCKMAYDYILMKRLAIIIDETT